MHEDARPRLRNLEVQAFQDEGREGALLVDPLGLIEGGVFVPGELLPVVARFTGERTIGEIAAEISGELGEEVPAAFVAQLAAELEGRLCLEGEAFAAAVRARLAELSARGRRPAANAGSAGYPAEPEACRARVDEILAAREAPEEEPGAGPLRALVAPHIDLARGARGYAAAYGFLAERPAAELYVVLGTGHQGPSVPLVPCALDFETPLGTMPADRDFLERTKSFLPAAGAEELLHLGEHSVEFQALFLRRLSEGTEARIAPFLTGALPEDDGDFARLCERLAAAIEAHGARTLLVAGADLAHLGPFFGDEEPVTNALLRRTAEADRRDLAALAAGRALAFARRIQAGGNPRRVCGTAPMALVAAVARLLDPSVAGALLAYGQSLAQDRSQVVSWAAMAFTGSGGRPA